jgi:hypothetical protein
MGDGSSWEVVSRGDVVWREGELVSGCGDVIS